MSNPGLPFRDPVGIVSFFVAGEPKPRPALRPFARMRGGKIMTGVIVGKSDRSWMDYVRFEAKQAMAGRAPFEGSLGLRLDFTFRRPASVSAKRRPHPSVKPDCTNLAKSTEDALKALVLTDDALVVDLVVSKRYGERPGVLVALWQVT